MRPVKFLSVAYEHFMAFRERAAVPLVDVGLVVVRGENRVSGSADSNGAGKSALVTDGPAWVLFGETLRGVRADAVACRHTRAPAVGELRLRLGDEEVEIRRTARPSTLRVSNQHPDLGIKELDAAIASMLGFGLRTFRNAVVFGQGAFDRFAQAEQADQLRMLDEIQGLDLRAARERAKAWADGAREQCAALVLEQRGREDAAAEAARQLEELAGIEAAFGRDKLSRTQAARLAVEKARTDGVAAARALEEVRLARRRLSAARSALANREAAQRVAEVAEQAQREAVRGQGLAAAALAELRRRVSDLVKRAKCPTCRATFDAAALKLVRAAFAPEVEAAEAAEARAVAAEAAARDALTAAQGVVAALPSATATEVGQLEERASAAALQRAERDVTAARDAAEGAEMNVARVAGEVWSGADLKAGIEARRAAAVLARDEVGPRVRRAETTVVVAEYWLEAFGDRGIRSLLFDSVAGFLNDRLAHHLSLLAAGEVSVAVSALTALKGGGARERVSVATDWAWGGAGRGSGSAGQDRRVDLALFAALQDLAESRSARPFPLKVWDEPGDALDAKGQELFARWVEREAAARGSGFLITHSQALAESVRAQRTWTVVMDRGGARVELGPGL